MKLDVLRRMVVAAAFATLWACALSCAAGAEVLTIGSQRELFVDSHLIDSLAGGARLQLHHPRPVGKAIVFDKPWEGVHCAYATVMKDQGKYRLYYRGHPGGEDGTDVETTCYAESDDGIVWVKPNLALFEVLGTKENNVVLAHDPPFSHNFSPLIDSRPGVPPVERYKALAGGNKTGLVAYISPDAIHWKKLRPEAVFRETVDWVFDSQNVAFWSEAEQCYVLYYRRTLEGIRGIARATSKDFVTWSQPKQMTYSQYPPTREAQLYTNQTSPYFRAPQIYLATAARFMQGRAAITKEQMAALGGDEADWRGKDCSDVVLMSTSAQTPDQYQRTFPEALVRPGSGAANWTSRSNYSVLGVVPTGQDEMSMYVQRRYGLAGHYLERLTLRLDGFASVNAPYSGGEMLTKPFQFKGKQLEINYSTSAAGSVRVEIQAGDGKPIGGFALGDCAEIIGDETARIVRWKGSADVERLGDKPIRLRFVMKDADLYSLKFVP